MGWGTGRVERSKKNSSQLPWRMRVKVRACVFQEKTSWRTMMKKTTMSERVSERVCFDDARWGPCAKMTVVFAANPENLETIIKRHAYVVYPPEGPKPPTAEEMRKIVEANKKRR